MIWVALGWLGNACFFSRFLVQWVLSERARRSLAPRVFWHLSLGGAVCLALYSLERGEGVLAAGALVNGAIALRNLSLGEPGAAARRPLPVGVLAALAGIAAVLLAAARAPSRAGGDPTGSDATSSWGAVVLVGQGLWSSRFVLQWWSAERAGASHFPRAFWWTSLAGNALLLAYALHLGDPVYVAGFAVGPLVQARNLMLAYRSGHGAGHGVLRPPTSAPRGTAGGAGRHGSGGQKQVARAAGR